MDLSCARSDDCGRFQNFPPCDLLQAGEEVCCSGCTFPCCSLWSRRIALRQLKPEYVEPDKSADLNSAIGYSRIEIRYLHPKIRYR